MVMKMETPIGTLTASKYDDVSHQGFLIELHRPNELIGMTVAFIEVDKVGSQLSICAWGNGLKEDSTTRVIYRENIEEFFKNWSEKK